MAEDSGCTENYCSSRYPKALSLVSWNNQQDHSTQRAHETAAFWVARTTQIRDKTAAQEGQQLSTLALPKITSCRAEHHAVPHSAAPQPAAPGAQGCSNTHIPAGRSAQDEPSMKGCSPSVQQRLPEGQSGTKKHRRTAWTRSVPAADTVHSPKGVTARLGAFGFPHQAEKKQLLTHFFSHWSSSYSSTGLDQEFSSTVGSRRPSFAFIYKVKP